MPRRWRDLVPRTAFIPDVVWDVSPEHGWLEPISRAAQPKRWAALVAADEAVTIQVDDGHPNDGRSAFPTSSSTAPWLMDAMLDALGLEPGLKVLEIGTGTGWNAAIMAAAGAGVTTIEIDPYLAVAADNALQAVGHGAVAVVIGDGEDGCPDRAPYDRVIATAAARVIPWAWVDQCRDGGRIVVPFTGEEHPGGLAVLAVRAGVASGTVSGDCAFMALRGQRLTVAQMRAVGEPQPDVRITVTSKGQTVH